MKDLSLSAAVAVLAGPALAHPGHEAAFERAASHWLTEADHLPVVLATVAVVVLVGVALRRANLR